MSHFDIVDGVNSVLHYDTKGLNSTFYYGYSIKTLLIRLYQTTKIESNMIDLDVIALLNCI